MADLVFENVSFTYHGSDKPALCDVSLTLKSGSFVLLCGPSGSGKSTFLRHTKPSLTPRGERKGRVLLGSEALAGESGRIGFVTQQTFDAIVTDNVFSELAFGPEQMGMKPEQIRMRIAEIVGFFGMASWLHRDTATLSGGQAQLLNLASVMVTDPDWLVLDEPTAQLDPQAEEEFLRALERVHRELGVGVLMSEHRTEHVLSMADRLLILDGGAVTDDGAPHDVALRLLCDASPMAAALPDPCRLAFARGERTRLPLTVAQGRQWLADRDAKATDRDVRPHLSKEPYLGVDRVSFRYGKDEPDVLDGAKLTVGKGEIVALLGANGSGKTTLLSVLAGALKPWRGHIRLEGEKCTPAQLRERAAIGWLPQDPRLLFVRESWWEDWSTTEATEEEKISMAARLCLNAPKERHPFDLSGGERQRAALGKLLLRRPKALLLDEPTKGLDGGAKEDLADLLRALAADGMAILIASHDLSFCAKVAARAAMLFDGQIVRDGEIHEVFSQNLSYTTPISRMTRDRFGDAITLEEVTRRWTSGE